MRDILYVIIGFYFFSTMDTPQGNLPVVDTTHKLRSPSSLLQESWQHYRRRWRFFLGLLVLPLAVSFAGALLSSLSIFQDIDPSQGSFFMRAVRSLLFYVPIIIETAIVVFGQLVLIFALRSPDAKFRELYAMALHKVVRAWWITLVGTLATFGGAVLLLLPGLYLGIAFTFALYFFVEKNGGALQTLGDCWTYIRGRWLAVVWRLILLGLVSWVVNLVAGIIFRPLPQPYYTLFSDWVVTLVWLPYSIIFAFLLYKDLVASATQPLDSSTTFKRLRWLIALGILMMVFIMPILLSLAASLQN